ncbi:hypothetical protein TWF696_003531 [Orbilia brochopaga]|uniref:Uncharacterized protein n=1 Tax=Orbilia brochopaga TaxID=3140254 RepID=A0AAV9TX48_9PEZI
MAPRTRSAGSTTRSKPKPDYTAHIRKRKTTAGSGDGISKSKTKAKPGPKPKSPKPLPGQPKPRGRPPKNLIANATAAAVAKPRGRPVSNVVSASGKPRGRPRKYALPTEKSNIIEKAVRAARDGVRATTSIGEKTAQAPSRRGRPPAGENRPKVPAGSSNLRGIRRPKSAEEKLVSAGQVPEKTSRKRQPTLAKESRDENEAATGLERAGRRTPRTTVTPKSTPQNKIKTKAVSNTASKSTSRNRSDVTTEKSIQDEDTKLSGTPVSTLKSRPTKSPVSRNKAATGKPSSNPLTTAPTDATTSAGTSTPGKHKASEDIRSEQKSGHLTLESPLASITSRPPPPPTPPPKTRTPKQTPKSTPKHSHTVRSTTSPRQSTEVVGKRARSEEREATIKDTAFPTSKRARTEERQLELNAHELGSLSGQPPNLSND